ncbi:MAG: hypothetical protein M0R77_12275 [Gammaproteobacteria bacterium]|nr:hypothetical protein [Gammaproteobacteria bacterium]
MTRMIQITAPPPEVDEIIAHIRAMDGVLQVQAQRGGSLLPRGDVLSLLVTNETLVPLMATRDGLGVTENADRSVTICAPGAGRCRLGPGSRAGWRGTQRGFLGGNGDERLSLLRPSVPLRRFF